MSSSPDRSGKKSTTWLDLLRWSINLGLSLVLIFLGLQGFAYLKSLAKPPRIKPEEVRIPVVRTVPLQSEDRHLRIFGYGTVRPRETASLAPQVTGRVVYVAPDFEVGKQVKKGQLLVEIDPTDYRIQVEALDAQLLRQQAEIANLQQTRTNLTSEIALLREQLEVAKTDLERMERAQEQDPRAVTLREVERTRSQYLIERIALQTRESAYLLIPSQLERLQAEQKRMTEEMNKARVDLERTRLLAPLEGLVISKEVKLGQFVTTFPATGVGSIASNRLYEIAVNLDVEVLQKLPFIPLDKDSEKNIPAQIRWTTFPQAEHWSGYVERIESLDRQTRTVPLIVAIPEPWGNESGSGRLPLLLGAYCRIEIQGRQVSGICQIPELALQQDQTIHILRENRLLVNPVEVLERNMDGLLVRLTQPWQPQDRLILSRLPYPVPDMPLQSENERTTESSKLPANSALQLAESQP